MTDTQSTISTLPVEATDEYTESRWYEGPGWYSWSDSEDPNGPFETEADAIEEEERRIAKHEARAELRERVAPTSQFATQEEYDRAEADAEMKSCDTTAFDETGRGLLDGETIEEEERRGLLSMRDFYESEA